MPSSDEKSFQVDAWGIMDRYRDVNEVEHATTPETRRRLLEAMGIGASGEDSGPPGAFADVKVLQEGTPWKPAEPGEVALEDGSKQAVNANRAVTLPFGYHEFRRSHQDRPVRLIVSPGRCFLPEGRRRWGWAVQLYASRSRASWGIGDLADLKQIGTWARGLQAEVLLVNPLTAPAPLPPIEASPYYPSSRRFRNPLYIRVEEAPGAASLGAALERLATAGRALGEQRRINRDAVFALKNQALEACFANFGGDTAFEGYRKEQGAALEQFATYCAIAEVHGKDWRRWPQELRRPGGSGVATYASQHGERVAYHAWLQWVLDQQLRQAAQTITLIQDLPIGLDVAGADAWCWQDLLAQDVSVGAPPDEFNPAGQDWGLIPFLPHRLRAAGYQPFIETIRATARHAGGLRIDHVMGLFRLFWIPRGAGPAHGAFVRPRSDELLAILAIESQRAKAFVIGEDLGTVEEGVRERMAEHRMLSYRLAYFEDDAPAEYPEMALTSVTTHDLPTIAGLWSGADLKRAQAAQVPQNEEGVATLRAKLAEMGKLEPDADAKVDQVIEKVHQALAAAPSRILLATLEDGLAIEERPNIPGAGPETPNWSLGLPIPIDELEGRELPRRLAKALGKPRHA
jgi:4-alpha-glucanotransferase